MPSICNEIISDIEDLISSQDITPKERYSSKHTVTLRAPRKHRRMGSESHGEVTPYIPCENPIPGTQTIFLMTWGCTHNSSDSEYMAGQLSAYGYRLTDDKMAADLWLLNSCTVKNPAEDHFRNEIARGRQAGKCVVVAGCVPQGGPKADFLRGLSVVGVQQIDRVVEVVEESLKGHTVRLLGQKRMAGGRRGGGAPLSLPKVRRNPLIEIIPINTGCLNQCSYCKTKHARGELGSYAPDEIVARAREAFSEGVREVWLTSEDTGAYGRDIRSSLPQLLRAVVAVVPHGAMLRVGMTNPPYILDHLQEMAAILSHPRVYSFLHVPVQSGSDAVLADMKREYCRADFEHVVSFLQQRVSGLTIATDIICGYPTETAADFAETLSLCAAHHFPTLFINQFYPRPGTPAARLPRIPPAEVKKRTKQLTDLFHSYEPYSDHIGSVETVLVTEESHDRRHYVGHTKSYQQVLVTKEAMYLGRMLRVEIVSASKHSMVGRVIGLDEPDKMVATAPPQLACQSPLPSHLPFSLCVILMLVAARLVWLFL